MKHLFAFVLSLLLVAHSALAAEMPVTYDEFKQLVTELAPKVNLFRDVWAQDPQAEFFGGTSRDYLYWLKGRLIEAQRKGELAKEIAALRAREVIDVRSFILFESDVDVVSRRAISVRAEQYGVKKIDSISAERFDPRSALRHNEINQGFIPAERIRLGKAGLVANPAFGDGAREIFDSKLTVRFAPDAQFWNTHYAKEGINHPILLALRYLRLVAGDYFQSEGRGVPDHKKLFARMPEADRNAVKKVVADAPHDPRLANMMGNERFRTWLNSANHKAFRSYTNTDAAKALFAYFQANLLSAVYGNLDPINQTLFTEVRDEKQIEENLKRYGVDSAKFFSPVSEVFPDAHLYHGTRTEADFRSIVFQGFLPSNGGSAGAGLYGVAERNVGFATSWGGGEDLVVKIRVSPRARIVDVTSGEGKRVFQSFGHDYESFAKAFGIDVIKYPYDTEAFIVKNAGVLEKPTGYKRIVLPLDELRAHLARPEVKLDLLRFSQIAADNGLSSPEVRLLLREPSIEEKLRAVTASTDFEDLARLARDDRSAEIIFSIPDNAELLKKYLSKHFGALKLKDLWLDTTPDRIHDFKFAQYKKYGNWGLTMVMTDHLADQMKSEAASLPTPKLEKLYVEAVVRKSKLVASVIGDVLAERLGHSKAGYINSHYIFYEPKGRDISDVLESDLQFLDFDVRTLSELYDKTGDYGVMKTILKSSRIQESAEGRKLANRVANEMNLGGLLNFTLGIVDGVPNREWNKADDFLLGRVTSVDPTKLTGSIPFDRIDVLARHLIAKQPSRALASLPKLLALIDAWDRAERYRYTNKTSEIRVLIERTLEAESALRGGAPRTCRALFAP